PVVQQSGSAKTVHMRHRCPKFGRQTFHENAACALKKEPWAKCFYEEHKTKHDDKHHQACRALAFKLVRIYFCCWKDRKPSQAVTGAAAPSPGSSLGGSGFGISGSGVAACAPDGGSTCGVGGGGVNLPVRTISATWAPSRVSYSSRQLAISSSLSRLL